MKIIILGNAGSGKSTLARKLISREFACSLSLDDIAFGEKAKRRPLRESIHLAEQFVENSENWVIEGCYADIMTPLLRHCEELIFLNPGIGVCVKHCQRRSWEPDKFETPQDQAEALTYLISWVNEYETRKDEYGLCAHRKLFNSFQGKKREYRDPDGYR